MEHYPKGRSERLREAQMRVEALEEEMEEAQAELERCRREGGDLAPLQVRLTELGRRLSEATRSLERALPHPHPCSERRPEGPAS